MFGVVNKLYICNQERSRQLSDRISIRNVPSAPLQPQYSMRPVLTKYSIMPILDQRATPTVPIGEYPTFNPEVVFNPGNAQAPWSGFSSNINTESILRNQVLHFKVASKPNMCHLQKVTCSMCTFRKIMCVNHTPIFLTAKNFVLITQMNTI
jgi:hypothetical protein